LVGFEKFDPKMRKEDDEERRGKEDETGKTKRIFNFGYLVCVFSRQVDSGCAGLRAVHVLSVCRLCIGQMAKE
jgi:hypothetical protein